VQALAIINKHDKRKLLIFSCLQLGLALADFAAVLLLAFALSLLQHSDNLQFYQKELLSFFTSETKDSSNFANLGVAIAAATLMMMIIKTTLTMILSRRILLFLGNISAETTIVNLEIMLKYPEFVVDQPSSQRVLFAMTRGVELLVVQVIGTFILLLSDVFLFFILCIIIVLAEPQFGVPLLITVFLLGVFLHLNTNRKAVNLGLSHTAYNIRSAEILTELLGNFRATFVRNKQSEFLTGIQSNRRKISGVTANLNYLPYFTKFILESGIIAVSAVMGFILFLSSDRQSALNSLILILASASRIAPAALRIQQGVLTIKSTEGQARETFNFLSRLSNEDKKRKPIINTDKGSILPIHSHTVVAKNLSFAYPSGKVKLFEGANFVIPEGSIVSVIGKSGVGKSTLADLILGIRLPTSGEILIGNQTPRDFLNSSVSNISFVPQKVNLFKCSIREYLLLGEEIQWSDSDLLWALETACFYRDNMDLEELLEYEISEGGDNLSGGQNQRLALAKAIMPKPRLLILDEITNAQDRQNEFEILANLRSRLSESTIILISHSNQVETIVDFVLEIDKKRVSMRSVAN
jgi:ABC-type multidrug transport system fused ATPase/permease subunit